MTSVSIIVPVYNVERYIVDCARSALSQTWQDIQFIFVDDASPDKSIDILETLIDKEFQARKPQISIIRKKVNEGLPQARRTGVEAATGDYILHLDSDDWLELDAVEKLVRRADETGADVVYFFAWKEFGEGRRRMITDKEFATPQEFADAAFVHKAHPGVVLKMWRRSLFTPPIFFPKYGNHEDTVQTLQLLSHARTLALLPEPVYHYRRTDGAAMSRKSRKVRRPLSLRNFLDLYIYYKDSLETSPIKRYYRRLLFKARLWSLLYDRGARKEYPGLL